MSGPRRGVIRPTRTRLTLNAPRTGGNGQRARYPRHILDASTIPAKLMSRDIALVPSPSQREAIEAEPRSLLVLAGPGAGKTYCLTERIRFLIEHRGFDPARICAFTFTNKAAGEIAHRLEARLGDAAATDQTRHDPRLLRRTAPRARRERAARARFGIADEEYQLNALRAHRRPASLAPQHAQRASRRTAFAATRCCTTTRMLSSSMSVFSRARTLVDFDTLVIKAAELLERPDDPASRAGARAMGRRPRRRVPGPESRAVPRVQALARDHRHVFARRRRRAVHLFVGRRGSGRVQDASSTTSASRDRFTSRKTVAARARCSRSRASS